MRARIAIGFVASLLALLALGGDAQAAITVVNQNDSGPGSLRQAVAGAPPGETIVLPAGTYTLTSETLQISKSVTIAGHSAADTTIRAGGQFGVIGVTGPADVTLSDVTVRDGDPVGTTAEGGGISSVQASLSLKEVVVTHNVADADGGPGMMGGIAEGGGIFVVGGSLAVIDSSVTGNIARASGSSGKGAGIAEGGGVDAIARIELVDSTFSGNSALAIAGQGPPESSQEGGISDGGGLFTVLNSSEDSTIEGSTLSGNVADASGGPGGTGGSAQGGGIYGVNNSGSIAFANSTIADNAVQGGSDQGGGAYINSNAATGVAFLSTTIAGNAVAKAESGQGGDIYVGKNVSFRNSIVAGGSAPAAGRNCSGTAKSLGFNLDSLDECGFHAAGDQVNKDPLLGPLQENGGPTQTMMPAPTSPVVDQGIAIRPLDQRGVARPIDFPSIANAPGGDGSDIGAVEMQPSGAFTLGKPKLNKKKGTATLVVGLPAPSAGTLALAGKGLKPQAAGVGGQTSVSLAVRVTGGAAKKLRKKGKLKVNVEITYSPTAAGPVTKSLAVELVHKRPKHRKHGHKHRHGDTR